MWASWSGSLPVIDLLILHGADPHAQNDKGASAAHAAAQGGHLDVCKYLYESLGADFLLDDNEGLKPHDYATAYGHDDVVEWISRTFLKIERQARQRAVR